MSKPAPKKGLQFFEKTHKYTLDGKPIPGVTTLIGGGVPKPALPYWAAKSVAEYVVENRDEVVSLIDSAPDKPWEAINHLKGIPWKKRDEAAVRGSEIHALADIIVHGGEVEVPDALVNCVSAYADFLERFDVQPLLTEVSVANRTWWYAGRLDFIGSLRWPGESERVIALLDWKSSKGVYGDTALQVAAYANAEFYVDAQGDEHPLPKLSRIGVVHVRDDIHDQRGALVEHARSDLHDLGDIDKAFKEFCSAAYIAKTVDRRKALIGEPLTPEGIPA